MDKETLLKEGLTEEQANKILALYSKREKEHSKAIEEKDSEITRLKAESKANAEKYSQDLKKFNIDSQVELALTKAGAKNNKAVKALLSEFLEKAELDEKGKLKGLDKEIKALQTSEDYHCLSISVQDNKPILVRKFPCWEYISTAQWLFAAFPHQ